MTTTLKSSSRAAVQLFHPSCAIHNLPRPLSRRHEILQSVTKSVSSRSYANPPKKFSSRRAPVAPVARKEVVKAPEPVSQPVQSPLTELEIYGDGINPPVSTLPPPLNLPEKTPETSTPIYWYRIGRAYGKFYVAGVKATYANYKKARVLQKKIRSSNADPANNLLGEERGYPPRRLFGLLPPPLVQDVEVYMRRDTFLRSQLQLLVREQEDMRKLPLFAVMVALFGEWLPVIVPFIPGRVPKTCRIPKQVDGMRRAVEERRRESFRKGISGPDQEESNTVLEAIKQRVDRTRVIEAELERESKKIGASGHVSADVDPQEAADLNALRVQPAAWLAVSMMEALSPLQLAHVSTSLGLHGKIWERLGLVGGESSGLSFLLKMRVTKRLHYLNLDDELLVQDRTKSWHKLSLQELEIACEERGIDVTGRKEMDLRKDLGKWLEGRASDHGYGREVLKMLFRRPNAW